MRRRDFIKVVVGSMAMWPFVAHGQKRERRLAILSGFIDSERRMHLGAFKKALSIAGWAEGRNLHIDYRSSEGNAGRLPSLAEELGKTAPDAVFALSTPALAAMRGVTRTIPTVFVNVSDPVDGGYVQSMARPGGNVTGFTSFEYSIGSKWLELLKEVSPSLSRVLVMLNAENYTSRALLRTIEAAAPALTVSVVSADIRRPSDIDPAISVFAQATKGGIIVLPDPATSIPSSQIIALAVRHRLPIVHAFRYFATAGSLMSYGADDVELYGRAGDYVSRILNGARPAELPVQNPTKFQFVLNVKTAKAMGLTIPEAFLLRADEVIE
jgi:putative ABC transport system substrate-binding protein